MAVNTGMKISEVLELKKLLLIENTDIIKLIERKISRLKEIVTTFPSEEAFVLELHEQWLSILMVPLSIQTKLRNRIRELEQYIRDAEPKLLADSMEEYKNYYLTVDAEFHRKAEVITIAKETEKKVKACIGKYIDWRYPGLEIGPGDGKWTNNLVGCDPLYLVDIHQMFLDSTKKMFNKQYQHRLRTYLTDETDLSMIPRSQIGFAFSWDLFHYLPLEVISTYLNEIFAVLRPGGTFMFSYCDGERPTPMHRVEDQFMRYTPKAMVVNIAKKAGFIGIETFDEEFMISWMEIHKPGILTSNRAAQTRGELIQIG